MREREGRLQRQHFLELRDGAIEIVTEIVDVADLRLHLKVERIEPLGLLQLDQRRSWRLSSSASRQAFQRCAAADPDRAGGRG